MDFVQISDGTHIPLADVASAKRDGRDRFVAVLRSEREVVIWEHEWERITAPAVVGFVPAAPETWMLSPKSLDDEDQTGWDRIRVLGWALYAQGLVRAFTHEGAMHELTLPILHPDGRVSLEGGSAEWDTLDAYERHQAEARAELKSISET